MRALLALCALLLMMPLAEVSAWTTTSPLDEDRSSLFAACEAACRARPACRAFAAVEADESCALRDADAGPSELTRPEADASGRALEFTALSAPGRLLSSTTAKTMKPSKLPTARPTRKPTRDPTMRPTKAPRTSKPTRSPTRRPTKKPSRAPTSKPTKRPTSFPTRKPTKAPTSKPTKALPLSKVVTMAPTKRPTEKLAPAPTPPPTTQVVMWTKSPTLKPTTNPTKQPTAFPTTGTKSPTLYTSRPTAAPNNLFKSPTNIPSAWPWDKSLFALVAPDANLCMVVRIPGGAQSVTYTNWKGTPSDCFRECQYDAGCQGAMYSATLRECRKATRVEIYDSAPDIDAYVAEKWTAYRRATAIQYYFNSYCDIFNSGPKPCNEQPDCAWNKGMRGWNQNRHTMQDGWCGRIKCTRPATG